ncbi:MAG TPA: hypothetical protein VLE49_02435 [Anaerolineales bacterium]|nr:hypothetical protein [Anaerolineales bacterium]
MKIRYFLSHVLWFVSCLSATILLVGCVVQPTVQATTPLTTATPETATAVGRIILGYGDHSPVPNLPLWLGKESQGQPTTYTDANGKFVLTGLPVGQTIDVVDDHLAFQFNITSSGIVDVGTFEYPLIHP